MLVAIDGSKYSDAAVQSVSKQAHSADSEVKVLHVIEPLPVSPDGQVWGFALNVAEILDEQLQAAKQLVARASEVLRTAEVFGGGSSDTGTGHGQRTRVGESHSPILLVINLVDV